MPIIDGYKFAVMSRKLLQKQFKIERDRQPMIVALTGHTESEFFQRAF